MSAIAHRPAAFELRSGGVLTRPATPTQPVWLRPTEDGWSLLAADGKVIYRGLGRSGRQECLEMAHNLGVLAVLS